jgi:ABC-type uncharacterized transport system permease subunit
MAAGDQVAEGWDNQRAMGEILLYALAALLYAGLAAHFWHTRWRSSEPRSPGLARWERIAILVPLAIHTWLLYDGLFVAPELRFGFGQALSVTLWLAVLIYWFEAAFVNLEGMQALVLPLAAVCVVLPALFPGLAAPPHANSLEFRAHLTLAMLAYSLFTIGALHALLMALLEGMLHGDRVRVGKREAAGHAERHGAGTGLLAGPLSSLPPLLTLERLLFRILTLGFVLLTLTLVTGALFSEELFGKAFRVSHKTLFAVISWVIFGLLLAGRWRYGWRGRKALRWTLAGFLALLLAYVGSRFVLEVVLGRSLG